MKSILISIKPKWVAKILNGEKTIEIRKTAPKCYLPIDVYIYCTSDKSDKDALVALHNRYGMTRKNDPYGKIVAKFTLREVTEICFAPFGDELLEEEERICSESCLSVGELVGCLRDGMFGYAYHVSSLIILDVPRRLSEFTYRRKYHGCKRCPYGKEYNPASDFSVCYTCSELLKVSRVCGTYMYVEEER